MLVHAPLIVIALVSTVGLLRKDARFLALTLGCALLGILANLFAGGMLR